MVSFFSTSRNLRIVSRVWKPSLTIPRGFTNIDNLCWVIASDTKVTVKYTHTHTHTHTYIYIYICVCVCVCVCTQSSHTHTQEVLNDSVSCLTDHQTTWCVSLHTFVQDILGKVIQLERISSNSGLVYTELLLTWLCYINLIIYVIVAVN